jgi:2'-5' RNA ligase
MVDHPPRYAVYFVPAADSALYCFGSAVLQYDCYTGHAVRPPSELENQLEEWRKATEEPRRYGFHATLKAPFYLAPSSSEAQLVSALHSFAAIGRMVATIQPVVTMLSGFTAIVPEQANPAVNALAADCTTIFDAFRAPMSPQERARRIASGLNQSQIENLDRWGYPYLFADFRFHMTLTGKIEVEQREQTVAVLRDIFQQTCGGPIAIDRLALTKQDTPAAAFRVLSTAPLQGAREGG